MKNILLALAVGGGLTSFGVTPALADLKLCNNTPSVVQVAIGYKDKEGWASEGWWTVKPSACSGILKGALIARYYYVYAVDEKKVGAWGGKALMCTKDKIFTIRGFDKCVDRGYLQQGFFEVDTGEKGDWTVSLAGDKATPAVPAVGAAPDPAKPAVVDPAKVQP